MERGTEGKMMRITELGIGAEALGLGEGAVLFVVDGDRRRGELLALLLQLFLL